MVAIATPTALPAPVLVCLGQDAPGISAEITVAPTVKELHTEPIGGQMGKVEMTLTFVVRLAQGVPSTHRPATTPSPAIPRPSTPAPATDISTYGNGSQIDPQNQGEMAAFRDYVKAVGHPPAARGALTQWVNFMKQRNST